MADSPPPPPPPPSPPPPPTDQAEETFYMPLYILSGVFGAIFIIGPLIVRKGEYRGIIRTCIMLSAFSMWLFWVTMYISQMNPLIGPRVENTTLAWIAYTWGKPAK